MRRRFAVLLLSGCITHEKEPPQDTERAPEETDLESDADSEPTGFDSDGIVESEDLPDSDLPIADSDTDGTTLEESGQTVDTDLAAPVWTPACVQRTGAIPLSDFLITRNPRKWHLTWWEMPDTNGDGVNEVMYCFRNMYEYDCWRVDFDDLVGGIDPGEVLASVYTSGTGVNGSLENVGRQRGFVDIDDDGAPEFSAYQFSNYEYTWIFHDGTSRGSINTSFPDWSLHYPYYYPLRSGEPLASGDVDGDGLSGDIVAAPADGGLWMPSGNPGEVWIDRGPFARGYHEMGDPDFIIREDDPTNTFGAQIFAEDVDLDGQVDLVISDQTIGSTGAVYIFLGPINTSIDTSQADAVFMPDGRFSPWAHFGEKISLGDANGDSLPDMLVNAIQWGEGGAHAGAAFLFLGPLTASRTTSQADFRLIGDHARANVGAHVKFLGDANGDGREDFAVASPDWHYESPPCDTGVPCPPSVSGDGAVFVFYDDPRGTFYPHQAPLILFDDRTDGRASSSVWRPGDLNGDGMEDLVTEDPRDPDGLIYALSLCEPAP